MQNPNTSTTPLENVFPWTLSASACSSFKTILVGDSIQSDGRFVLHAIAAHVLSSSSSTDSRTSKSPNRSDSSKLSSPSRLLWLAGGPVTPVLIASGLKKMGCDVASSYLRDKQQQQQSSTKSNPSERLCIRSLSNELAERVMMSQHEAAEKQQHDTDGGDVDVSSSFLPMLESFTMQLYKEIKAWVLLNDASLVDEDNDTETPQQSSSSLSSSGGCCWIILDDVSAMASLVGTRLTYGLILSLFSLLADKLTKSSSNNSFGLVIRYSQDAAQERAFSSSSVVSTDWIGAGGGTTEDNSQQKAEIQLEPVWESSLIELVDWVVDVCPLESGATREAHGRLLFWNTAMGTSATGVMDSTTPTTAASSSSSNKNSGLVQQPPQRAVYNYCLTDTQVLAIRIYGS